MHNIAQAQLFEMSSATTTPTPTTTYPFTYTTWTNTSPSSFTKPTEFPSIFSFGPAVGCASKSANPSASAQPSNYPLNRPVDVSAGFCVISNAAEHNDHAFWDMYACCASEDISAIGSPLPCTAICKTKEGQTFHDLGWCLNERVDVVICSPPAEQRGNATDPDAASSSVGASQSTTGVASGTMSGSAGVSSTVSGSSSASASSASASSAVSTGAASTVGGVQGSTSKAGLVIFGLLALGSAAGMFV
jgi:hypothetical protein